MEHSETPSHLTEWEIKLWEDALKVLDTNRREGPDKVPAVLASVDTKAGSR